jgi:hypothetical protein
MVDKIERLYYNFYMGKTVLLPILGWVLSFVTRLSFFILVSILVILLLLLFLVSGILAVFVVS